MKELFKVFKHSAYRIESLPNYKVNSEEKDYFNFINGQPVKYGDKDWIKELNQWPKDGKKIKRIRVISEELTSYEKYEFNCYHENFLAGEEIKVLPRSIYENLVKKADRFDFWIFDEKYMCKLNYDSDGTFLGSLRIEKNINKYIEIFNLLESKTLFDYTEIAKQINNYKVKINFNF